MRDKEGEEQQWHQISYLRLSYPQEFYDHPQVRRRVHLCLQVRSTMPRQRKPQERDSCWQIGV